MPMGRCLPIPGNNKKPNLKLNILLTSSFLFRDENHQKNGGDFVFSFQVLIFFRFLSSYSSK